MKLWIDDVRPAPEGYLWCKSVDDVMKKKLGYIFAGIISSGLFGGLWYEIYGLVQLWKDIKTLTPWNAIALFAFICVMSFGVFVGWYMIGDVVINGMKPRNEKTEKEKCNGK